MAHPILAMPPGGSTVRATRDSGTVLLVSDSSDDRGMYADYLRSQGFRALEAQTAAEAYSYASQARPAVVIVDVRLPGDEDGLDLTRRLKQDVRLRDVPVVIVTGYVSGNVRHAAECAGCDLFVVKPCLPDALSQIITSLISRARERCLKGIRHADTKSTRTLGRNPQGRQGHC